MTEIKRLLYNFDNYSDRMLDRDDNMDEYDDEIEVTVEDVKCLMKYLERLRGIQLPILIKTDILCRATDYIEAFAECKSQRMAAILIHHIPSFEAECEQYYRKILPKNRKLAQYTFWQDIDVYDRRYYCAENKTYDDVETAINRACMVVREMAVEMNKIAKLPIYCSADNYTKLREVQ